MISQFTIGNLINLLGLFLAYVTYRIDQHKQKRERLLARERVLIESTEMHAQNTAKLTTLIEFHRTQMDINRMRDRQVSELEKQTVKLTEIALGFNRRLEMIEDNGR